MKKVLFTAAFAVAGLVSVSAQTTGIEGAVHVGIPVGETADVYSFNIGADLAYLHPVSNNFKLGAKVGYDHFIGKEFKVNNVVVAESEDVGFIPLAATAKFEFNNNLFIGADLGYAFATTDGIDGGLFWQPKVGYSASTWDLYAGYKGINAGPENNNTVDWKYNAVSVGFNYKF
ncbi:hypothetical protein SAMN05443634_1142 [Chishuiella changwenlii]|uniref:Outer membrane protein beta-barrel domain-containing protein n=1 Tax=Chishuiella changwenlii TaxID=1434701 RepID=A0A1M7CJ99_9FLAO|nr:hypothetical protein [Chishuiella changwenlii]GGE96702.1 hypothetical protein GCM10010984_12800 [Chishuiella changwenlii]SHL67237.1 hypothetical protein SAMN05443634_1142 [Chishuiella changwenlii]